MDTATVLATGVAAPPAGAGAPASDYPSLLSVGGGTRDLTHHTEPHRKELPAAAMSPLPGHPPRSALPNPAPQLPQGTAHIGPTLPLSAFPKRLFGLKTPLLPLWKPLEGDNSLERSPRASGRQLGGQPISGTPATVAIATASRAASVVEPPAPTAAATAWDPAAAAGVTPAGPAGAGQGLAVSGQGLAGAGPGLVGAGPGLAVSGPGLAVSGPGLAGSPVTAHQPPGPTVTGEQSLWSTLARVGVPARTPTTTVSPPQSAPPASAPPVQRRDSRPHVVSAVPHSVPAAAAATVAAAASAAAASRAAFIGAVTNALQAAAIRHHGTAVSPYLSQRQAGLQAAGSIPMQGTVGHYYPAAYPGKEEQAGIQRHHQQHQQQQQGELPDPRTRRSVWDASTVGSSMVNGVGYDSRHVAPRTTRAQVGMRTRRGRGGSTRRRCAAGGDGRGGGGETIGTQADLEKEKQEEELGWSVAQAAAKRPRASGVWGAGGTAEAGSWVGEAEPGGILAAGQGRRGEGLSLQLPRGAVWGGGEDGRVGVGEGGGHVRGHDGADGGSAGWEEEEVDCELLGAAEALIGLTGGDGTRQGVLSDVGGGVEQPHARQQQQQHQHQHQHQQAEEEQGGERQSPTTRCVYRAINCCIRGNVFHIWPLLGCHEYC